MFFSKRRFRPIDLLMVGILFISIGFVVGCSGEHESMVDKADREAVEEKPQLAIYLYLQVIEQRKERDHIRYRALKGLAQVGAMRLNEYRQSVQALEKIFEEYGRVSQYETEIRGLRLMAARIWRINLENPNKALDVLSPLIEKGGIDREYGTELAKIYLAVNDYKSSAHWFSQSLEMAKNEKNCTALKSLQLDLIQVYAIQDKCQEVFELADMKLPRECQADSFGLAVERANCFEITGDVSKASEIYQGMIKKDPKNLKAHFLLDNLMKRQKQKLTR